MTEINYPNEILDEDYDDGTIVANVNIVRDAVVGHKIVKAEVRELVYLGSQQKPGFVLTLDNGTEVRLFNTDDCCAYTQLDLILLNIHRIEHVIMGVGTTEKYTKWHIYCDYGDVLEMTVGWSCGNPFYYGYGFDIDVVELEKD